MAMFFRRDSKPAGASINVRRALAQQRWCEEHPDFVTSSKKNDHLPEPWVGPAPDSLLNDLTSREDLYGLTWWQFDEVIAALFRRLGATRVKVLDSTDGDAGIDIRMLFEGHSTGLQCLFAGAESQTPLKTVERFASNLRSTPSKLGYFISTGLLPYPAKAKLALAPIPIYLLDGSSIWTLILNSRAAS
jgi:hypothetical protein